ncbi:MAG TPA: HupE/UreJ family protein [Oscillatoriaceae cyanobacterium M33_DOE_052]|uniref:Hydantoin utilization protein A n=1 Tax=Planktothricoides sp. SpSt-374 TaxID=2282167 RepID=A0A7C3VTJ2_9CYAN|nr:HupE/UreJ family protein [Oscillatoriaceae cyanobacterium M33_DOE_052]
MPKLKFPVKLTGVILFVLFSIVAASPAMAHHAFGGETPTNFWEGFLSGLAHPIIGLDHFAFVVAVGLLAVAIAPGKSIGIAIPAGFILTTIAGVGLHLTGANLPLPELVVAASVFAAGGMLATSKTTNWQGLVALAAIAGIFHGYAYGEAIVGAEMTPLWAYLTGFTIIQMTVAAIAFNLGKTALENIPNSPGLYLRFAGFTICGIGASFLASAIGA